MSDNTSDFFRAGGTLSDDVPSYVTRPADDELLEQTRHGMFCYVLTSRQMGKSSLMVRTAQRLREQGITPVDIDLTEMGVIPLDEWYPGLLTLIAERLDLPIDVGAWWYAHQHIGAPQRFRNFLRDEVLLKTTGQIVVFIDEIDTTLQLDFRDDFFIAIRAMYNARTSDPIYARLTFVLLGVASPTDLIRDQERTPFNIGQAIALQDFTYAQAEVLHAGLEAHYTGQSDTILSRIFYWTHGHPFQTQQLCLAAIEQNRVQDWDAPAVDALVAGTFFSDEGRKLAGIDNIQRSVQVNPVSEQRRMLKLYRDILQGKPVAGEDRSLTHIYLELYGLVRMEQGQLYARNRIYQHLCSQEWIAATLPVTVRNERRNTLFAISSMIFVIVIAIIVVRLTIQEPADIRADEFAELCENAPENASGDGQRLICLDGLFNIESGFYDRHDNRARVLFYRDFSPEQQKNLFLNAPPDSRNRVETVVRGIYISLDTRTAAYGHDRILMEAMRSALTTQAGDTGLIAGIEAWNHGRDLALQGQFEEAIQAYGTAIALNDEHPVVRFDRAMAYIERQQYGLALTDLDNSVQVAMAALSLQDPSKPTGTTPVTSTETILVPLKFIGSERVIQTVNETVRDNPEMLSHFLGVLDQYPAIQEALPVVLIDSLTSENAHERTVAIDALGQIVIASPHLATPDLIERLLYLLDDRDKNVRQNTIVSLGRVTTIQPQVTDEVVKSLIPLLGDVEGEVRTAAAAVLGEVVVYQPDMADAVIAPLVARLDDADWEVRATAAAALGDVGAAQPAVITPEVVVTLVDRLNDADAEVRTAAAAALRKVVASRSEMADAVVTALLDQLNDEDAEVRAVAATALGDVGTFQFTVIMALVETLDDTDAEVRVAVAETLGRAGNQWTDERHYRMVSIPPEMVIALVDRLNDPDADVRATALRSLMRMTLDFDETLNVVRLLVERLDDPDADVRATAAWSLGLPLGPFENQRMGRFYYQHISFRVIMSKSRVPPLMDALDDPDADVRTIAARSLWRVVAYHPQTADPVVRALNDADAEVRTVAMEALSEVRLAKDVVRALSSLSYISYMPDDQDVYVPVTTEELLGQVGAAQPEVAAEVVAALTPRLDDADANVREAAAAALGQVGTAQPQVAAEVVAALTPLLEDNVSNVREAASTALAKLQNE